MATYTGSKALQTNGYKSSLYRQVHRDAEGDKLAKHAIQTWVCGHQPCFFIFPAVSTWLRFFLPIQSKHIPFQDMEKNNIKLNKTFFKKILEQNQTMSFFSTKNIGALQYYFLYLRTHIKLKNI